MNREITGPPAFLSNDVNSAEEVKAYDPGLYRLLSKVVFPCNNKFLKRCSDTKTIAQMRGEKAEWNIREDKT